MGSLGFPELLVILVVVLLLFGAKRLPEVGKAVGDAIREFKRAMSSSDSDSSKDKKE